MQRIVCEKLTLFLIILTCRNTDSIIKKNSSIFFYFLEFQEEILWLKKS